MIFPFLNKIKKINKIVERKGFIDKSFVNKLATCLIMPTTLFLPFIKKYRFRNHEVFVVDLENNETLTVFTKGLDSISNGEVCIFKNISFNPIFFENSLSSENFKIHLYPEHRFDITYKTDKQSYQCFGLPLSSSLIQLIIEDYFNLFKENISENEAYIIFLIINSAEIFICDEDYLKSIQQKFWNFPEENIIYYEYANNIKLYLSQKLTFSFLKKSLFIFYYLKINSTIFHNIKSNKVKKYLINLYSAIYFYIVLGGQI
jgi:hypothetical protein